MMSGFKIKKAKTQIEVFDAISFWVFFLILFVFSCGHSPSSEHRKISSEDQVALNYPDIFLKARETLELTSFGGQQRTAFKGS